MASIHNALISLDGLSIGDSFGQCFLVSKQLNSNLDTHTLPPRPWYYTDDTEMSLSVVSTLAKYRKIEQASLAKSLAEHYDYIRAYGPSMHRLLERIRNGEDWQQVSGDKFEQQGSWGNGAAMRAAPIGAFFSSDPKTVTEQAARSAEVTHAHDEAILGAVAVALAASIATQMRETGSLLDQQGFLSFIIDLLPQSEVRSKLIRARSITKPTSLAYAVAILGNGTKMSAADTVPFALWCCSLYLDNFTEALWLAVSAGGDSDTLCAIVGGVVACFVGSEGIPTNWRISREPLPEWFLNVVSLM